MALKIEYKGIVYAGNGSGETLRDQLRAVVTSKEDDIPSEGPNGFRFALKFPEVIREYSLSQLDTITASFHEVPPPEWNAPEVVPSLIDGDPVAKTLSPEFVKQARDALLQKYERINSGALGVSELVRAHEYKEKPPEPAVEAA